MKQFRNFCIIAHIDHGKSTLSDRMIQLTNTVKDRDMKAQLLDSMDLERERGITIKMQAVRMDYTAKDGQSYILNLIDTPGHVDFSYEVSRSLAACEGALLLIDAAQGIEAQTMANFYLALEHDLEIIPVINKVDLPSADPERVIQEIELALGIPEEECLLCSAKTGIGIEEILEAVSKRVPSPKKSEDNTLRALIYDSLYDDYRGVINYIRVFSGKLEKGQKIKLMATGKSVEVNECGYFKPKMTPSDSISEGGVGYVITGIKSLREARVGDTITSSDNPSEEALPGYKEAKPMVFCGLYPVDTEEFKLLGDALEKLQLNDSSLNFETESSQALGFGYRCGFLGLLHMEIIQERIEREFNIDIVVTSPNVTYKVELTNGDTFDMENPNQFPEPTQIESLKEPVMGLSVISPNEYISTIIELVKECRGGFEKSEIIDDSRQMLTFFIPLNELITQFFDRLKSRTKGYASMDYWYKEHSSSDLAKVNMLINGEPVDALSFIAHKQKAPGVARGLAKKLKDIIPQQMFEVAIQGSIGAKVICRENIKALRKNVTARCYGGDITRKRKLLEKQKAGKKKMKQIGSVTVPKEAFLSILKSDN
ncbi:elongation factor 4 [Candidatus Marinamargulisbacteria bacterium SCGC AG-343-D04]|nr:elongation factor 4 [Candidatus Marinamargulisbacteria bacterium SCGC AG-343-D04]